MDLKDYYFSNVKEDEYHYCFYNDIENVNKVYNIFTGEKIISDYSFEVFDAEEAIQKFRELCQPNVSFDNEKTCWFHLITYYLYSIGYEIKEFPRLLARPPKDPLKFTYNDIRDKIIAMGEDDNGTVKFAIRRKLVAGLTFELKKTHINISDSVEQKFIEISNRNASFDNMSTDEKLAELANIIEHYLKKNGKFIKLDYSSMCCEYITEDMITSYRKKLHCFRHSTDEAIAERKLYSENQKSFFIDYGITIVKVIHKLVQKENRLES